MKSIGCKAPGRSDGWPVRTTRKNLKSLMDVSGKWIDRVRQRRAVDKLIPGLNSSASETYGRRERLPAQLPAPGGSRTREIKLSHDASVQVTGSGWFRTSFCETDGRTALILQA